MPLTTPVWNKYSTPREEPTETTPEEKAFLIGDSTLRSMKEFWKGSIKKRKILFRPKATIEVITEQVKELECKNTDLVITQVGLDNNRVTLSEELLKQMEDLSDAVQEKTSNHIMLGLLPRTMCRNQKYKDDKILYINKGLKTLSEKKGLHILRPLLGI